MPSPLEKIKNKIKKMIIYQYGLTYWYYKYHKASFEMNGWIALESVAGKALALNLTNSVCKKKIVINSASKLSHLF